MKQKLLYLIFLLFLTVEGYSQKKEIDSPKHLAEKTRDSKKQNGFLLFLISDNGKGFDDSQNNLGEGLNNIKNVWKKSRVSFLLSQL